MNDKELLTLAAKAAGIEVISDAGEKGLWIKHKFLAWNPLTDDADAMRLAVKLSIDLLFMPEQELVYADGTPEECRFSNDPYAATRRAIVRAASEIGRGME